MSLDPCTEPYDVERCCCHEALQVCFGEPKVTGAQATASDALRVRALDAGTSCILLSEFRGAFTLLMLPGDHFFLHSSRTLLLQAISDEITRWLRR